MEKKMVWLVFRFVRNNVWQLGTFYGAAILSVTFWGKTQGSDLLLLAGILLFMHVIPTLGVPFGAFSQEEAFEKWLLQHLSSPSFGFLFGELAAGGLGEWPLIIIVQFAYLAVLSYWSNSVMSREFRWKRFLDSNPDEKLVKELAALQILGRAGEADVRIQLYMSTQVENNETDSVRS